mmetsp:Transcript_18062/g.37985  ORF Transcript_18062/g.37985 Transcript_18062/m.37985 type:complete len:102 (-) Transcript_18062:489-794(-)
MLSHLLPFKYPTTIALDMDFSVPVFFTVQYVMRAVYFPILLRHCPPVACGPCAHEAHSFSKIPKEFGFRLLMMGGIVHIYMAHNLCICVMSLIGGFDLNLR